MGMAPGAWTWLEVAKLAVSGTGPIVVLILGLWIKGIVDRMDQRLWSEQNTIKWRLTVFERLAPKLNLLFSVFAYVGRWKETRPPDIIALKRDLDELVFTYDFLWSENFRKAYSELINACFELNQGPGKDAKIRANIEMFRHALADWDPRWNDLFVPVDARTKRSDIRRLVDSVVNTAVHDLGLNLRRRYS
jgi:hypothetical protein